MALPEKREDLIAVGYVFTGEGRCRSCGAYIEWWVTPRGKRMPMSVKQVKDEAQGFFAPVEREIRVSHFSDCPNAEEHRRK